jgi:hypothetical protein
MLLGLVLFTIVVAIPWIWGMIDLYTAYRFYRDNKSEKDKTAFLLNWLAFKWGWTNYADVIVEKMPFFKKDLTETFGIRDDDGRIT